MLASLIIVLREGIEAALVIGLTLSYLERTGRLHLRTAVWMGLGLAILGSVLAAMALQLLPVNEEAVEGTLMLVAAVFVGATMIWMHRARKHFSTDIKRKVDAAAARGGGAWALGLFVFFMVLREGAETVLFLSAVTLSSSGLMSLLGAVIGLLLAIAFAVAFFQGALQLDLNRFFAATTFVLGVLVIELLLHAYHEFSEIGWLPATTTSMAIVGPAVKNSVLFVFALLAVPLVLMLVPSRRPVEATPELASDGPAARKAKAMSRRKLVGTIAYVVVAGIIIVLLGTDYVTARNSMKLAASTPVSLQDGHARIPLEGLAPDTQHRYVVAIDDRGVRFFVYIVGHEPRVALDACEICGDLGYVQQGRQLICVNCGAEILPASLGQSGGCNPIPLPFEVEQGAVLVPEAALRASAAIFDGK